MIEIVSATRMTQENFWTGSALGISLSRLAHDTRLLPKIEFENQRGLPDIFNERIVASDGHDIVVFIHDDVWIDDFFLADRILDATNSHDVFGVVGNRRCLGVQPSWAFLTTSGQWDDQVNLSGSIAHGSEAFGKIGFFGPTPEICQLLDGVFIGSKKSLLKKHGLFFDTKFKFHFYDVDFCMGARQKNLKVGTWPIALTHQSQGSYNQSWIDNYQVFFEKWKSLHSCEVSAARQETQQGNSLIKQTLAHDLINHELMTMIPANVRRIVDIGCMHGQMARVFKASHPAVHYVGIDIDPDYAKIASNYCDQTIAANVENLPPDQWAHLFPSDCWIFGDCLEHLRDPWSILRKIRAEIDAEGCVLVCIHNAQHWEVQQRLLSGQFRYEDNGLMDRTHLRWFTRTTLLELFQETGWKAEQGLTRTLPAVPYQDAVLAGIRAFSQTCGLDPEVAATDALPFQYMFKLIPS